jgi:L-ascorbate metabolism protein UlaG (beta-lactamase superfamily)
VNGAGSERLTWLGHSTVLIETAGTRLLTDPVLRRSVGHLRRRGALPRVPDRVDAVLVSHLHHDHLDLPSIRALDPAAMLVVPRGARRMRAIRGMRREVHEVAPGDAVEVGAVRVRAVEAVHDGRRVPWGPRAAALGFVLDARCRCYFAGDTEVFDGMRAIGDGLDVALLPVAGWGPRLGPGHMDAGQAAEATALLRPAVAVPIHWGTFRRIGMRDAGGSPAAAFARSVAERAPGVHVSRLAPGDSLVLRGCPHHRDPPSRTIAAPRGRWEPGDIDMRGLR